MFKSKLKLFAYLLCTIVVLAFFFKMSSSDPLMRVCNTSEYKRVVEDTCSSIYKRTKHTYLHFKSHLHHHSHHHRMEKHRRRHYFSKKQGNSKSHSNHLGGHPGGHLSEHLNSHLRSHHLYGHTLHDHHLNLDRHSIERDARPKRKLIESSLPLLKMSFKLSFLLSGQIGLSDLPERCCQVGCPHSVYAAHCDL